MSNENRYLKTVKIRNFQSHRETEVHLVPGINLVVGTSDVGKSAFMRAVNMVMHNEIPNREFVTYGEQNATVILEFSDGTIVERVKGATKNAYYVTLPDGTSLPFDKVGVNKIPDEVMKALGNPPIDKRHGPLAYADQHSPLFLVSLTPTELPRAISELTGLDDYETASLSLAKKARQFDRQIREGKDRITHAEAELESYNGLDVEIAAHESIQRDLVAVEALRVDIVESESELHNYQDILRQGKQTLQELNQVKKIIVLQEPIEECLEVERTIEEDEELLSEYLNICEQIDQLQSQFDEANCILDDGMLRLIEDCKSIETQIAECEIVLMEYKEIMTDGKRVKSELDQAQQNLILANQQHQTLIDELTKNGMICPECNQLIGSAL